MVLWLHGIFANYDDFVRGSMDNNEEYETFSLKICIIASFVACLSIHLEFFTVFFSFNFIVFFRRYFHKAVIFWDWTVYRFSFSYTFNMTSYEIGKIALSSKVCSWVKRNIVRWSAGLCRCKGEISIDLFFFERLL